MYDAVCDNIDAIQMLRSMYLPADKRRQLSEWLWKHAEVKASKARLLAHGERKIGATIYICTIHNTHAHTHTHTQYMIDMEAMTKMTAAQRDRREHELSYRATLVIMELEGIDYALYVFVWKCI